ncbi:MAG: UDP-glucose 4-epimerase GalE [Chitinivibrionales bacterium]|nr:UDP-glucose 4-epimerase GalE [Chitinivibrionales bacterium]
MNILVVGGAGYIGSHVARAFLDQNHTVTVYDNLSLGRRENLFDESEFVCGDILDYDCLVSTMKQGFDGLVHLAAFKAAGESMLAPEKYATNNISGTISLLNAAAETGIKNIVFSSSSAVYGEQQYLPIDEAHPLAPESFYGFTKLEIERLLDWYSRLKGLRYAALRYFNAAGYDPQARITGLEKNPANLLPVIMEVASGIRNGLEIFGDDYGTEDGTCIRDYIHVSDLADAHVRAMHYIANRTDNLIVNLGSETGVSVLEMVEAARRITGTPVPARVVSRRAGDPEKLVASSGKANELLGWKAKYSDVDSLVATTWSVYRKNSPDNFHRNANTSDAETDL